MGFADDGDAADASVRTAIYIQDFYVLFELKYKQQVNVCHATDHEWWECLVLRGFGRTYQWVLAAWVWVAVFPKSLIGQKGSVRRVGCHLSRGVAEG